MRRTQVRRRERREAERRDAEFINSLLGRVDIQRAQRFFADFTQLIVVSFARCAASQRKKRLDLGRIPHKITTPL
jgi:hypothetical protein